MEGRDSAFFECRKLTQRGAAEAKKVTDTKPLMQIGWSGATRMDEQYGGEAPKRKHTLGERNHRHQRSQTCVGFDRNNLVLTTNLERAVNQRLTILEPISFQTLTK